VTGLENDVIENINVPDPVDPADNSTPSEYGYCTGTFAEAAKFAERGMSFRSATESTGTKAGTPDFRIIP
jgi:hypothetical protein